MDLIVIIFVYMVVEIKNVIGYLDIVEMGVMMDFGEKFVKYFVKVILCNVNF